jgi:hypothetical protein
MPMTTISMVPTPQDHPMNELLYDFYVETNLEEQ